MWIKCVTADDNDAGTNVERLVNTDALHWVIGNGQGGSLAQMENGQLLTIHVPRWPALQAWLIHNVSPTADDYVS